MIICFPFVNMAIAKADPIEDDFLFDVDITSGPTGTVCPGQQYTFTASSSSGGCFYRDIYEDGSWLYGSYPSGCNNSNTSSTFTHTFSNTPQSNVKVQVTWASSGGGWITRTETRYLGIHLPKPANNLGSEVTFCSTNQSKNFTIDGLDYNPSECDYHYRYTYEVPSGWTVAPPSGVPDYDPAANIAWTQSKNVTITAPSSISNGKAGVLKVRTNHPSSTIQSENVIDIQFGTYTSSQVTVNGQTAVCPGNQYFYTASPSSGSNYSWTYPSGWSKVSQAGNQVTLSVPFNNNQYGAVRVSITNDCGASSYSGVTVFPGYSCGSFLMAGDFKIYPNPADNQLSIELTDNESADNSGALSSESSAEQLFTVLIYNKQQRLMVEDAVSGSKKEIDVSALPSDTYLLHIQHKGKIIKEQIVIK